VDRFDQLRTFVRVATARRIATRRMVTCASPGYLVNAGVPGSFEELRSHRCVGGLSSQSGRLRDWSQRIHARVGA
jgi:hypothetical protein